MAQFQGTHISSQQRDVFRMYNVVKCTPAPSFIEIGTDNGVEQSFELPEGWIDCVEFEYEPKSHAQQGVILTE
jgi:hypothetical protein